MDINECLEFYGIPIGAKVIIKECHAQPAVVGRAAKVTGWVNAETFGYPLMVYLDEVIYIPVPGAGIGIPFRGPHFCRPDELQLVSDIPDIISKAFEEDDKKDGGTA